MPVPSARLVFLAAVVAAASLGLVIAPGLWPAVLVADLLIAGAALLDLALTPRRRHVSVERRTPARFSVLKSDRISVTVRNSSGQRLRVELRDVPPSAFRASAVGLAGDVPPFGEAAWSYDVVPLRRGKHAWGPTALRYRSALGFWQLDRTFDPAGDAFVYPNLSSLDHYRLLALADRVEATDARPVRRPGGSAEFESLRDYAFGDDTRKLDWKATARRGKLIVRHERAERNQTVLLMIDSGRLMNAEEDGTSKLDHAVNAALLLAQVALARGDRVGLCSFSHKVHAWLAPRGGVTQGKLIAESLFDLRGDYRESDPARALQFMASRHPKRSLVVVLTDFVDTTTAADLVEHLGLAARRHVVLLAALKDVFLKRATAAPLTVPRDGFRRAAAVDLLRDREEVLEKVRHRGGFVIDAAPADLTPRLLNRYLEIVLRGMI